MGNPWLTAFEEVHSGMDAAEIERVLRDKKALKVLPLAVTLDHGTNMVLHLWRRDARADLKPNKNP